MKYNTLMYYICKVQYFTTYVLDCIHFLYFAYIHIIYQFSPQVNNLIDYVVLHKNNNSR